jgi:formylglycine-generating enzyme required for sulfatase activity
MSETDTRTLLTTSIWHRPQVAEEAKDRLARRKANAAVALLRLGRQQKVWPLLQHRPDPRTRSYLIHRFRPLDADPHHVLSQLDIESDDSIRRSLILILGEFNEQQFPTLERERLIPRLLALYFNDPDPGIHGAAAWTLRQWGRQGELQRADQELATGKAEGNRRWYVNRQGQTLVIIPPPGEIVIGSPPSECGRMDGPEGDLETQHHVRIDHAFAIMVFQVTVSEFLRFREKFIYRKQYAPEPDCPINSVTWYEVAAYCNWLNEQEGIPKEQYCYLPNDEGAYAQGMKIVPDCLQRTGYRMPTEREWEFACRAGSITSRYYGQSPDLDNHYGWTVQNSLARSATPVGRFKPNDLGLFDMMGNLMDWCQDEFAYYDERAKDRLSYGYTQSEVVNENQARALKGASLAARSDNVRSTYQWTGCAPNSHTVFWGLRLSRSCLFNEDVQEGMGVRNDRSYALRGPGITACPELIRTSYFPRYSPNVKTHAFGIRAARTMG